VKVSGWLAWRYFRMGRGLMSLSTTLSFIGMVAGVGSLVVAMAVVSGYETTLKKTVIDATSHLVIARTGGNESREDFKAILNEVGNFEAYTPFVFLEAVLAHDGKISGVGVEGLEDATVHQVLRIKNRLTAGEFSLVPEAGAAAALIGKGLAKKHGLKIGDRFRVVLPVSSEVDKGKVKPRISRFYVTGILDLGRHDFDERYIMTDIKTAQEFAQIGDRVSGYRFRLKDDNEALILGRELQDRFRPQYTVQTWYEVNSNLFRAIDLEKPTIFLVLLVIVIAAAFNISSTMFVSVLKRFRDISILKSMGARNRLIVGIFASQGLLIGFIGSLLGLAFGLGACGIFVFVQNHWGILPAEVYKLDRIYLELRFSDLAAILLAAWFISLMATLGPALRGAWLSPVEGLKFE
jgi:lipoprotein-releasing system permease protein